MDQLINYKHKIDFLISNDTSLIQQSQTIVKKNKRIRCGECNKKRTPLDESHPICHVCCKAILKQKLSGKKIIDDFIKHTQINYFKTGIRLKFVPHSQFKNIEFIAEGGFSKIYRATWIDGPVINYNKIEILIVQSFSKNLIILRTSHLRS